MNVRKIGSMSVHNADAEGHTLCGHWAGREDLLVEESDLPVTCQACKKSAKG